MRDSRTRILYLVTELAVGGSQSVLLRLLERLDSSTFSPSVVCLFGGDGPTSAAIRRMGIPVTDLGLRKKADLTRLARLFRVICETNPHAIHSSFFHANILARVLGRLAGVSVVICTEQTMEMESSLRYRLNRLTAPLATAVVCNAQRVADFCSTRIGIPSEKLVVIHDGVPAAPNRSWDRLAARRTLGLPEDRIVVGTLGRLDPVKGLESLLRALHELPKVHWLAIGDGPERPRLERLADDIGIADRVHWAGYQPDFHFALSAVDIHVQSSHHEGLPGAVLEAMTMARPVVATNVGGTAEIVVDRQTGFLVPPRDASALADAIRTLADDDELRSRLGSAGARRVSEYFSAEAMAREVDELYRHLLGIPVRTSPTDSTPTGGPTDGPVEHESGHGKGDRV